MISNFLKITILILLFYGTALGVEQKQQSAQISGKLLLDQSWDTVVYLSYIPTFNDLYAMSNEMIIASAAIDSTGRFSFDIDFLPAGESLLRLHIIKKGDSPATLIIGGKDENHLFLLAGRNSNIRLHTSSSFKPFREVVFKNSGSNVSFQKVSNMVYLADSLASESTAAKRSLIEVQLQTDLLHIADTSDNLLVSLYAIYKSKFESNYNTNEDFYRSYTDKWSKEDNLYYESFRKRLPQRSSNKNGIVLGVLIACILALAGYFLGKQRFKRVRKIEKLSIQERKIFELLQQGASNQEISNRFNIELSTVKSHVRSIYSKLKVKSRKDIMNLKH